MFKRLVSKISVSILIFFTVVSMSLPVFAVGTTGQVGTDGNTGTSGQTGTQGQIGTNGHTGVQESPSAVPQSSTEATNSNTGSDSTNTNTVTNNTDADITQNNSTDIDNDVDVNANTGGNNVSSNTTVGDVNTGDVTGTVTVVNAGNSHFGEGSSVGSQAINPGQNNQVTLDPISQRAMLGNNTTGSDSTNTNTVINDSALTLVNNNNATVGNGIDINADTGNNILTDNTQLGNIATGDVDLGVNLVNLLNVMMPNTVLTLNIWSLLSDYNGDIVVPELANRETGSDSSNINTVENNTNADIEIINDADISNDIAINTNTGNNTLADNTVVGDVSTGNTTVDAVVQNIANVTKPVIYIVNVFGEWVGSLFGVDSGNVTVNQVGNEATGSDSTNANEVTHNTDIDATQTNTATANNRINVNANTGNNTVARNTEVGNVSTGNINVYANVVNMLNTMNTTLDKVTIGILNVFGNWRGNMRGTAASSPSPTTTATTVASVSQQQSTNTSETRESATSRESSSTTVREDHDEDGSELSILQRTRRNLRQSFNRSEQLSVDDTSESNTDTGASTRTISFPDIGAKVKSFKTQVPDPKQSGILPANMLQILLVAGIFLGLWGASEVLAGRKKKLMK